MFSAPGDLSGELELAPEPCFSLVAGGLTQWSHNAIVLWADKLDGGWFSPPLLSLAGEGAMNRVPPWWPHTAPVALYGALAQQCQVCLCQAITILESQGSGTGVRGLAAFLVPVIAEAMPEQTQHKGSGGGVKVVFRKHHKPLFVQVQCHHFAGEKGKETLCYPFLHSFPFRQPQVCACGIGSCTHGHGSPPAQQFAL